MLSIKDFYIFCLDQQEQQPVVNGTIVVSGAAQFYANGLYNIMEGVYNGMPYWQSSEDNKYLIIYNAVNSTWDICNSLDGTPDTAIILYSSQITTSNSPVGLFYGDDLPVVQSAYNVLVSNAGDASANGIYTYAGVINNFPYYSKDVYEVWRGGGIWIISKYDPGLTNLYNQNTTGLPTPYNVINPQDVSYVADFSPPAPTVTAISII